MYARLQRAAAIRVIHTRTAIVLARNIMTRYRIHSFSDKRKKGLPYRLHFTVSIPHWAVSAVSEIRLVPNTPRYHKSKSHFRKLEVGTRGDGLVRASASVT